MLEQYYQKREIFNDYNKSIKRKTEMASVITRQEYMNYLIAMRRLVASAYKALHHLYISSRRNVEIKKLNKIFKRSRNWC